MGKQPKKRSVEKVDINNSDSTRSQDKIEAILQGAMQEFLTHGFAATTMDKVTAAAGVSKTTVYSYFQDKETLFIALIEHLVATCGDVLNPQNLELFAGEPRKVLADLATNFLNQLSQNVSNKPELLDLIRLMIAESGRFPMLAQHMVRHRDKQFVQVVTQYLRSRPELQLTDPEATTRVFLGTLIHFVMVEYMLQAGEILPMERQRLIDCLVDLITCKQTTDGEKYSAIKDKSSRRKRSSSGKFERDYAEPKRLRSIRLTDTAWENLDEIAQKNNLTRTEFIELLARGVKFD
jgi:AcrR family transcriptional regulator